MVFDRDVRRCCPTARFVRFLQRETATRAGGLTAERLTAERGTEVLRSRLPDLAPMHERGALPLRRRSTWLLLSPRSSHASRVIEVIAVGAEAPRCGRRSWRRALPNRTNSVTPGPSHRESRIARVAESRAHSPRRRTAHSRRHTRSRSTPNPAKPRTAAAGAWRSCFSGSTGLLVAGLGNHSRGAALRSAPAMGTSCARYWSRRRRRRRYSLWAVARAHSGEQ